MARSLLKRDSRNGYSMGSMVRMPGSTTVGQNSGGMVLPKARNSHGGMRRVEPSRNMTYQSGWEPAETTAALYGPNSQIGLIWKRPPSIATIAKQIMKKPPALTENAGNIR